MWLRVYFYIPAKAVVVILGGVGYIFVTRKSGGSYVAEHPIMLSGVEAAAREMLSAWSLLSLSSLLSLLSLLSLSSLDIAGIHLYTCKTVVLLLVVWVTFL